MPKKKHPGGRPLELTRKIIKEAETILPVAFYKDTLADFLGITIQTLRRWIREGAKEQRRRERGKEPEKKWDLHVEFCSTIKKKLSMTETACLKGIFNQGIDPERGQWTALMTLLERTQSHKYGQNQQRMRDLEDRIKDLEAMLTNALTGRSPISGPNITEETKTTPEVPTPNPTEPPANPPPTVS